MTQKKQKSVERPMTSQSLDSMAKQTTDKSQATTDDAKECSNCGESRASTRRREDDSQMCDECWTAALAYGHLHGMHDEHVDGCPTCASEPVKTHRRKRALVEQIEKLLDTLDRPFTDRDDFLLASLDRDIDEQDEQQLLAQLAELEATQPVICETCGVVLPRARATVAGEDSATGALVAYLCQACVRRERGGK